MAQVSLPMSLGAAFWEKQKAALAKAAKPPVTKLADELKALTRLHLAVDWDGLGDDKLDSAEKAAARAAELEQAAKGKLKLLVDQAQAVEASAAKFETEAKKDKGFPKEPLVAVAAIVKAAREYRADVGEAIVSARKAIAARAATLATQKARSSAAAAPSAPGAGTPGAAEAKAFKIVRTRALDAIRRIRKPAPNAPPVRFIVVQGKASIATYLGPSVGPTQEKFLKSLIAQEMPFKTLKDPKGFLVWEKNAVTFVSDVLPAGVVKKMQLWLKKLLKLNVRLRIRRTDGAVEESEGDDLDEAALAVGPDEEPLEDDEDEAEEATSSETPTPTTQGPSKAEAMDVWTARRTVAVTSLKKVAGTIAEARHPRSTKAIIELQAVMKNLTAAPASLQQVTDLQRWLATDEVVAAVCELAEDFRAPLLQALAGLRATHAN